MRQYKTEYPNQVHQLSVSASKHYYCSKSGELKYQKKPMEVSLDTIALSRKNFIVNYILTDHCTGVFYYEIASSNQIIGLVDFLYRAWIQKEDYSFCGIPEMMSFPQTVERLFPGTKEKIEQLGVVFPEITGGFQSGIRNVRTVEGNMGYVLDKPISEAKKFATWLAVYKSKEKSRNNQDTKIELWRKYVKPVREPPAVWVTST